MDPTTFLITGANGQLGTALRQRYPEARAVSSSELDISSRESVEAYDWTGITAILNAAAYTNVDGAETADGRRQAWLVNSLGVANLSLIARERDLTLVHISSEYVFDGTITPHTEDEPLSPLGVYAQTKAAGDIAASLAPKHYILRTSWVIGEGKNFVRIMMGLAEKNIAPTVVADQIGRLTFTTTLVDAIHHLLANQSKYGIYNVSNDGQPSSWADVTRAIFKELGRDDLAVTDTTTEAYFASKPEAAPRPLQSELDLSKIKATGLQLRDWRDDLAAYIKKETEA
ncbi:MAG TPA: NAD(P)-dependent oxidoreductase [Candidatus Limnocylindrales bacterium]|nr:NAD(P)-dependent oxidoreductase [Candidatus Limnocylindrales bacterium]